MSIQHLRLILTESPALICDIHACNPELSILRDFALERIADGAWNPKAQFPAHSLLAWAEARALAILDGFDLQPQLKARWADWIRRGVLPEPERPAEFRWPQGQIVRPWLQYIASLHDFRHAHYKPGQGPRVRVGTLYSHGPRVQPAATDALARPGDAALLPPEYPRPEGEILRELEAAEDTARWAHLMQLWTARTGKTWSQSCQST